jgi:hypothetical protein
MKIFLFAALCCLSGASREAWGRPFLPGCELAFSARTWWPLYHGFTGDGTIRCRDGRVLLVHVVAKGPGLTIDHWNIRHGKGRYTCLRNPDDAFGRFVTARDGAQLVKSTPAAMPESERPHLALGGTDGGRGINDLMVLRTGP